jgi:hypothetical protein
MSYRTPFTSEKVVFVDQEGNCSNVAISKVIDVGAGIVELNSKQVRYVDPAGATQYESNSWHFILDDTSKIQKQSAPESLRQPVFPKKHNV